jgi:GAF domain-containing protein
MRERATMIDEHEQLEREVAELRAENERLREDYGRAASEHAYVGTLLAACHRLHSTLDRAAVLVALEDALVSLIGCREAAVYELAGEPARLALVAAFGVPVETAASLPAGAAAAVQAGRLFIAPPWSREISAAPSACFPLRVDGRVVGAIALFREDGRDLALANADWAALDVIGPVVATALLATRR